MGTLLVGAPGAPSCLILRLRPGGLVLGAPCEQSRGCSSSASLCCRMWSGCWKTLASRWVFLRSGGPRGAPWEWWPGVWARVWGCCSDRLCFYTPQTSALREIMATWEDRRGGPKGEPGERGAPGKEVCGCSGGGRECGCTAPGIHSPVLSGFHRLSRRPRPQGRAWGPRPSGPTWLGSWGEGPPWISWSCRRAGKTWHPRAPRPGWGCRGDRKARRAGEPEGEAGRQGSGERGCWVPRDMVCLSCLLFRENEERRETGEQR